MIMGEVAKIANCMPPHWNTSLDFPTCNSAEKMKFISAPGVTSHLFSLRQKQVEPCVSLQSAAVHVLSEQQQSKFGRILSADEEISALVVFAFNKERYREIRYTQKFDIESLIGNVGGYIGLFLGFAIWQLADLVKYIATKLNIVLRGKIYHTEKEESIL